METTNEELKESPDNVNNPNLENGGKMGDDSVAGKQEAGDKDWKHVKPQGFDGRRRASGINTGMSENASQLRSNSSGGIFSQEWASLGGSSAMDSRDLEALSKKKEKQFMKMVEENNYIQVQALLWKQKHEVRVDATNELGYSALAVSCISNSAEMMKILLSCGCQVKEELLICIEQDFREGARMLLDKMAFNSASFVNKPPVEGRNIFPQGATAVKVASAENNVEMLKLLRYYNAEPIQMPDVSPETGTQTLEETLYTMKALASPAYCLVMGADDPMMTAMKVSQHCTKLARINPGQRKTYEELSAKMEQFGSEWFGMAGDDYEVNMLIGLKDMTKITSQSLLEEDKYCRLRYAIENRHSDFVAHSYCQSALLNALSANMPSKWSGRPLAFKLLYFAAMFFLFPVWILFYWLVPKTESTTRKLQPWLDWPYMKCVVAFAMYAIIQIALIVTKNSFQLLKWPHDQDKDGSFQKDLEKLSENEAQVVPPFDILNFYIFLWTIGNIWAEVRKIHKRGLNYYKNDSDSRVSFFTTFCFTVSAFCCLILWCSKYNGLKLQEGEKVEDVFPQWVRNLSNIQEVFMVIGNIFLFQRLINWMRLSSYFGKTIYLALVSLPDIFYFFFIFTFFLFSFSISINGALWRTYADVLTVCDDALRGNTTVKTLAQVAGVRSEVTEVTCLKLAEGDPTHKEESVNFMKGMISARGTGVELLFTLFGASRRNSLLTQFHYYNSPQELVAAAVYAIYTFFMVLVRLNILIALIVAALNQQYKKVNTEFKFHRAKVIIAFTDPDDPSWIPSPLNLIPTLRSVQAFISDRIQKRRLASGSSDSIKAQVKFELMERENKTRKAVKVVIDGNSRRMLRKLSKEKAQNVLSVDDLQDFKAALNPRFINAKSKLQSMQMNLKDLLDEKIIIRVDVPGNT